MTFKVMYNPKNLFMLVNSTKCLTLKILNKYIHESQNDMLLKIMSLESDSLVSESYHIFFDTLECCFILWR